jgi:glycosyltransferase involved in cell wall biosynthesis
VSGTDPLVVVPALNEEQSVGEVVERTRPLGYPICVVDDGSRDRTGAAAEAAGATVLTLPVNLGVGGALRCGFRFALETGHRIVVQIDGDGQHDPSEIPALLDKMRRTGADMVVGSRFLAPNSAYPVHRGRRVVMGILAKRATRAVGSPITDATSGFRAIRVPLLTFFAQDYPVEYLGDTFEALVAAGRRGAKVVEEPITAVRRRHGRPTAGLVASGWYVLRVLTAASLVESRVTQAPLDRTVDVAELFAASDA